MSQWTKDAAEMRSFIHREAIPKLIHQRALEKIEGDINKTLDLFDAEFRVRADEGLGFLATFVGKSKKVQPHTRLSGGQRVTLAIAFRMAISSHFAGQVGMMVLDEPTAGLDSPLVGSLGEVFSKLSQESKNLGLQVIVVTHEARLSSFFDQIIQVTA
jgi:exonuclease SbcC